jgi:hypothetical protein
MADPTASTKKIPTNPAALSAWVYAKHSWEPRPWLRNPNLMARKHANALIVEPSIFLTKNLAGAKTSYIIVRVKSSKEKNKMTQKIGDFTLATGWDPRKHKEVLISMKIDGKAYNMISLRQGLSLTAKLKIAKDIRLNYGYSVRLINTGPCHEVYVHISRH